MVAAVDQLDGELEVLLALLRVRVQAHRPLLAKLQNMMEIVDQLISIDGDMYPPNQPKPSFGQLGLTQ